VLQSAEEIFPAVSESMVSVLCLCAQKRILLLSSVNSHGLGNETFHHKLVLVFLLHVESFLRMVAHIITNWCIM
jgi:hypothetical protein